MAKQKIHEGKNRNAFYLPDFIQNLSLLSKEFPLWISAALPYYASHASSSYVEGYFNDLKTRVLIKPKPPMRVDYFIRQHILDILGATPIFCSNIQNNMMRSTKDLNNKEGNVLITTKIQETEKASNDLLTPSSKNIDVNKIETYLTDNVSPFVQNLWTDIESNILEDSDLKSVEDWKNKAQKQCNADGDYYSSDYYSDDESICSEYNVTIVDDTTRLPHSVQSDFSYVDDTTRLSHSIQSNYLSCKIEKTDESKYPTFCTDAATKSVILKQDPPPIKVNKYFKPYPEIRQINQLISKKKKPFLLPNGSKCMRPWKIDGKQYFIKNTCSFDSLVHILMASAIDDVYYASVIEQLENSTLKLVFKLINEEVSMELLRNRAEILKDWFPTKFQSETERRVLSYTIDAWSSIHNVVNNAMASVPSIHKTEQCTHCDGRSYSHSCLSPNHNRILKQGFGVLQQALDIRPIIYKINCTCCGLFTLYNELNFHFFIELNIRDTSSIGIERTGQKCQLRELPETLKFNQKDESIAEYG